MIVKYLDKNKTKKPGYMFGGHGGYSSVARVTYNVDFKLGIEIELYKLNNLEEIEFIQDFQKYFDLLPKEKRSKLIRGIISDLKKYKSNNIPEVIKQHMLFI